MSAPKSKTSIAPDKKAEVVAVAKVVGPANPPPEVCVTDSSPKSPLIVVSNRLPFVLKRDPVTNELERKASAGGLVTAVCPVVIKGNGIWVGWSGIYDMVPGELVPECDPQDLSPTAGLRSSQVFIDLFNQWWCEKWTLEPLLEGGHRDDGRK